MRATLFTERNKNGRVKEGSNKPGGRGEEIRPQGHLLAAERAVNSLPFQLRLAHTVPGRVPLSVLGLFGPRRCWVWAQRLSLLFTQGDWVRRRASGVRVRVTVTQIYESWQIWLKYILIMIWNKYESWFICIVLIQPLPPLTLSLNLPGGKTLSSNSTAILGSTVANFSIQLHFFPFCYKIYPAMLKLHCREFFTVSQVKTGLVSHNNNNSNQYWCWGRQFVTFVRLLASCIRG